MKKKTASLILAFILSLAFYLPINAKIDTSAKSAVLMCLENGEILYSKNSDTRMSMASTTKIMTSLIALEQGIPNKEIVVTKDMVSVEGTSMGLLVGDSVSFKELIYGMLLQSGNDAAHSVACIISGNESKFSKQMNKRAAEIGMKNTNFVTASGLDSENHFSTAYDMALLACECLKNPEFLSICSKKTAKLTYGNPPYPRTLTNHNKLLWSYEGCIGVKTGFTKKSGRCLVSAARRNGITLVAVTLNAPNDWSDHISMFDYGFSKMSSFELNNDLSGTVLRICGGNQKYVSVRQAHSVKYPADGKGYTCKIFMRKFEYAPISKDETVGRIVYYSNGKEIATVPLLAESSVEYKEVVKTPEEKNEGVFSKITKLFNFQR